MLSTTRARRFNVYQFIRHRKSLSSLDSINSDVVIVGGGPAGLALASALGSSSLVRKRLNVTVLEAGDLSKVKAWNPSTGSFSNRVSSLTNQSQAFLRAIGCWDYIDQMRTCSVEHLQVWDGVSDARIDFFSSDLELAGMARLIENLNLQRAFLRHLNDIPEITILNQTKVSAIGRDSGGWPLIHLASEKVLRTRLLIGADGFNSPVRLFANIPSFGWSYDTQALVATMYHSPRRGSNTTAYQRFLPTGPIAFLPLTPSVSSLVWSTTPSLAKAFLDCDSSVFCSMINSAFRLPNISIKYLNNVILKHYARGTRLSPQEIQKEIEWREESHSIDPNSALVTDGQAMLLADSEEFPPFVTELQAGSIASFPLRFNHTESYIGDGSRTVLIGDAAHTLHPLAGQGLNLGLADAECLAQCIHESLETGGDIGSYATLQRYQRERYLANHTLMSAVDKLHKIYSTEYEPIVWCRSVGLEVLNEIDSIKAAIMISAGGKERKSYL